MRTTTLSALLLLPALLLAGCAEGGGEDVDQLFEDEPDLDVTSTTGGIRGVVVDEAVRPVAEATVEVQGAAGKIATTNQNGIFTIAGLPGGTHVLRASHPLFDTVQQSVEVVAGVADPPAVRIQLTRVVFAEPYLQTIKYDGFIVCSANVAVALSEECGEGVGVPCEVPAVGCQRVGGQGNNNVQFDFTVGPGTQTLIIEQVWEPTSEAGREFFSPISTEWSCDPVCGGNTFAEMQGPSPLYVAISGEELADEDILPDSTVISVFTWSSAETNPVGVVLNQQYQVFVTTFHYLPAPEGWSFVAGDPNPFE